jgi:dinuclear metal center YbgI/SA1388 family protein
VALRDEIIAFLDELLDPGSWDDYGPNGLQVPGAEEVSVVATGVSAHRELFERAAAAGAELVLCHHGLFWRNQPREIDAKMKARLEALFDADMSLAAYHLPLDAHPEVGNNALLCEALGLERGEPFGMLDGRAIGFVGRAAEPVSRGDLVERCTRALEREPLVFDGGPEAIETVGIVTGGGASSLPEAIDRGLDAFLTGEPSEPGMADSREAGINFIAGGHWATETFGVRRLGDLLAERFGVEHRFLAVPNPV